MLCRPIFAIHLTHDLRMCTQNVYVFFFYKIEEEVDMGTFKIYCTPLFFCFPLKQYIIFHLIRSIKFLEILHLKKRNVFT